MGIEKDISKAIEKYQNPKNRVKAIAHILERNYNFWNSRKVAWKRGFYDLKVAFQQRLINDYGDISVPEYDPSESKEEMIRKYINYNMDFELDWIEGLKIQEIDEILIGLFEHRKYPVSLFGISGLLKWGSPAAIHRLSRLTEKRLSFWTKLLEFEALPTQSDASEDKSEAIHPFIEGSLEAKSFFWTRLLKLSGGPELAPLEEFLENGFQDHLAVNFLRNRHAALLAHPENVCQNCICKATLQEHQKGWDHIVCPSCGKVDFLTRPVKEIKGYIGDLPQDRDAGMFSLWNTKTKEARPGDIDHLHIVEGEGIDYNWAIAAIFGKIQDFFPDRLGQITIHLDEEVRSQLNENAQRILGQLSKQMEPSRDRKH